MDRDLEERPDSAVRADRGGPVDLARSARRGVFVTSGSTGSRTVLTLLTSVVLARLLEPSQFGIVAVAATFLGLSFIIGNLGLGFAVIQAKTLDSKDRNTAFFLASGIGLLFAIALSAISPVVARFFEMPVLTLAMPIMSLQILLSAAAATPIALLRRELRFGRVAVVEIVSALVYGIFSVGLALLDFGVWSLVWAPLAAGLVSLALALALSRFLPGLSLSWAGARRLLSYGGMLTAKNMFVHISRHADKFIIAKLLGAHATGLYARAFNWGSITDMRLMPVLQTVSFPVFCRVRGDRQSLIDWYVKVATLGTMAMVPLSLGLLVLAEDFTAAVFGDKWLGIVPSLRILCLVGLLNSVNRLSGAVLEATGQLRYEILTQSTYAVLLLVGALLGAPHGIEAVAWAVLGATVVLFCLKGESLRRAIGLPARRYLGITLPSLGSGLVMVAAVYLLLAFSGLPNPAPDVRAHWLRLGAGTLVAACTYPLALFLVARGHLSMLLGQLRQLRDTAARDREGGNSKCKLRAVVIQGHAPYPESIYRRRYDVYAKRLRAVYIVANPDTWSLQKILQGRRFDRVAFTGPGLLILRVSPVLPGGRLPKIASINRWLYLRALLRHMRKHVDGHTVLVTQQPLHLPTLRGLPALRVYDVIDDYVGLQLDEATARAVCKAHVRTLRQCDVVWATASELVEAIRKERPDVVETTNGVDYEMFSKALDGPVPEALSVFPGPVVGLIGRLNDRVDWTLLEKICHARSAWSVVVVGPLYGPIRESREWVSRLQKMANFHHLPAVPEEDMPSYIAGFDVCLIPYKPAGSNLSVNPLKLYQYLAVGKPVVATPLPILGSFTDVVEVRDGSAEFITAIETALRSGSDERSVLRRRERAKLFDWHTVADSQIAVLEERLSRTSESVKTIREPGAL